MASKSVLQQIDLGPARGEASGSAQCRFECGAAGRVPWLDRQAEGWAEGLRTTPLLQRRRQQYQHCTRESLGDYDGTYYELISR